MIVITDCLPQQQAQIQHRTQPVHHVVHTAHVPYTARARHAAPAHVVPRHRSVIPYHGIHWQCQFDMDFPDGDLPFSPVPEPTLTGPLPDALKPVERPLLPGVPPHKNPAPQWLTPGLFPSPQTPQPLTSGSSGGEPQGSGQGPGGKPVSVPEPGTWALFGAALLSLLATNLLKKMRG